MLKLIPEPTSIVTDSKKIFPMPCIRLGESGLDAEVVKDFLDFLLLLGIHEGDEYNVFFEYDASLEEEEYTLVIDENITVKAKTVSGRVYALQTLKQIFFQCGDKLPHTVIKDKPVKKIRGFMLDSGRYFFPLDDVKCMLRRMALHKLNLFHFHITEDQGWRIEIDKYPLLTEKGSVRKRTNFTFKEHRGFYTKKDIQEIVRYAHAFGIKVMPEFDIPGHSRAAIACYPYLSCFERKLDVADHWGVKHDVLCAGKDSTYTFVKNILDEFCEMFDDEYFHIGGDEVPKHRWRLCPDCQKKISELVLPDEEALQCYFMNEVKEYLKAKGKQVFMWSWDLKDSKRLDEDLGFTKCGATETFGRPFIDTSTDAYYIDLPYGYVSLENSAEHKLLDGNCLGVEATLWTEYVPNMKKADKMTYPRLFAVCEAGWNGQTSYSKVKERLDYYYSYLDRNSIGYSTLKTATPSKVRGFLQGMLFERRQLAWEGLHNIFDDKKTEKIAKNLTKGK